MRGTARHARLAAAVSAAVLVAVPATAPAAATSPRADLAVPSGSVRVAGGSVAGTVVVRNAGRRRAGASSASLIVRVAGKRRTIKRFAVPALAAKGSQQLKVSASVPEGLSAGSYPLELCADAKQRLRERSESNNCRRVGTLVVRAATTTGPAPAPAAPAAPPAQGPPAPSTVPAVPLAFTAGTPLHVTSATADYWVVAPAGYDATHATPYPVLVGAHGCGDTAQNYLDWAVRPFAIRATQGYLAVSVGGRDGACWTPGTDVAKVLGALADLKTHFNVNPRRVVLNGYSSGGDLAYSTAFHNANLFAGVLAMMTQPFTPGSGPDSEGPAIAAAAWKLNIVHVAHLLDTSYLIATVRSQTTALRDAGFPVTLVERSGTHDAGSDDAMTLVAHMSDPWLAPAP